MRVRRRNGLPVARVSFTACPRFMCTSPPHPLTPSPPHPFTLTPTRPCFSPLRYKNFFRGGWNIFDSLIVFLGTVSLIELACDIEILPPSLGLLRPFRAFRVFRLFKRVLMYAAPALLIHSLTRYAA